MQGAGLRQQAAGLGLNVLGAGNQMAGLAGSLNAQAGGLARGAQESKALGDEYILKGAGLKRMGWQDANAGLSAPGRPGRAPFIVRPRSFPMIATARRLSAEYLRADHLEGAQDARRPPRSRRAGCFGGVHGVSVGGAEA